MLSLQQNQRIRGRYRFFTEVGGGRAGGWEWEGRGGGRWQTMYTHVSKCKNDKIKTINVC
jgi:hypothetical protein